MKKIIIFGNSGSGKSTLAKSLCESESLSHLDLDTLAWQASTPPERKPLHESVNDIEKFIGAVDGWVIEGCYADLLEQVLSRATEVIYLNLPVEACIRNARDRSWEPHKYESKKAQDANLELLIDWITQYEVRTDTFSERAHRSLFDSYEGKKTEYVSNAKN